MCARNIDDLPIRPVLCLLSKHSNSHFTDGKSQHLCTSAHAPAGSRGKVQDRPLGPPCPDCQPSPRLQEAHWAPSEDTTLRRPSGMLSSHQGKRKATESGNQLLRADGVSLGIQSEAGAHTEDRNSPGKRELGGKSCRVREKRRRSTGHPPTHGAEEGGLCAASHAVFITFTTPLGVVILPQITDQKTKPLGGQATGQGHTAGKDNRLLSTGPAL